MPELNEAKAKLARFCAYQERSQKEVREKLYELGIYHDHAEEIIAELISENYLNEERFAKSFAGGKFRMKKWGRKKIEQALKQYDISEYCIKQGLQEINPDDYMDTLKAIVCKKNDSLKDANLFVRRNKLGKHAISRGFEPELVWDFLKQHIQ